MKIFKPFPHYKSMEAIDPQNVASKDPMGLIGRIYEGDHIVSEEDFYKQSHYKPMDLWA